MFSRKRFVLLTGVVALAVGGSIAWATIPSKDGTINGCYGKFTGIVRIIDPASDTCQRWEKPIFWNQTGQAGTAGPTSLSAGRAEIENYGTVLATHTVTAEEAGLNLITATATLRDKDGQEGGVAQFVCSLMIGKSGEGDVVTLQDTGIRDQGDTASWIMLSRTILAPDDVVAIRCEKLNVVVPGPSGVTATARLMLEHVNS